MESVLRETLRRWRPPPLFRVPEPTRLAQAAAQVRAQLGDTPLSVPPPAELEETLRVVRVYWSKRELHRLPPFHLRRSPWVLFLGQPPHLGDQPRFVYEYLLLVSGLGQPRMVAALVHVLLREYPTQSPAFETLRAGVARLLLSSESPRLRVWQDRCQRFGLLEKDGPRRFARIWAAASGQTASLFEQAGVKGDLAQQGFVVAAYDQLLHALRQELANSQSSWPLLEPVLAISEVDRSGLRYPTRRKELAEALLLPFVDREAPEPVADRIKGFLMHHYGHPRVKVGNWHGVHEQAINVMVRWQVRASLDVFFQIVDETARPEHWRYRRAFWEAYLREHYITDAWVVLGPRAAREAKRALATLQGSFGLLKGGQPDHSVLLMTIGGLTVAEWSHAGSCRIWDSADPRAPRLYQSEYTAYSLRNADPTGEFTHRGSTTGSWQHLVSTYIQQKTGIRMSLRSLMP